MKIFLIFLVSLITTETFGGSTGKSCPFRPPGPRSGPNRNGSNPHAKSSINSYLLNNLYYTGLNMTYDQMKLPANAGKKLIDVARSIQLPPALCSIFQPPLCNPGAKYSSFDGSCIN